MKSNLREVDEAYYMLKDIYKSKEAALCTIDTVLSAIRFCNSSERIVRKTGLPILLWAAMSNFCRFKEELGQFIQVFDESRILMINLRSNKNDDLDLTHKMIHQSLRSPMESLKLTNSQFFRRVYYTSKEKVNWMKHTKVSRLIEFAYNGDMGWVPDPLISLIWTPIPKKEYNCLFNNTNVNLDKAISADKRQKYPVTSFNTPFPQARAQTPQNIRLPTLECLLAPGGMVEPICEDKNPSLFIIRKKKKRRVRVEKDFENFQEFTRYRLFEQQMVQRCRDIVNGQALRKENQEMGLLAKTATKHQPLSRSKDERKEIFKVKRTEGRKKVDIGRSLGEKRKVILVRRRDSLGIRPRYSEDSILKSSP